MDITTLSQDALFSAKQSALKSALSTLLYRYVDLTKDFGLPGANTTTYIGGKVLNLASKSLINSDLLGLELMTPTEYLDLSTNATLTGNAANISSLTRLKYFKVSTQSVGDAPWVTADITKWTQLQRFDVGQTSGFDGDLSGFTNLNYIFWQFNNNLNTQFTDAYQNIKLPVFGNNISLATVSIQCNQMPLVTSCLTGLSNCVNLITFSLTNTTSTRAQIDSILSQLHTLKSGGSPLTTVALTGANAGIPTGFNANTDAVALRDLGVTVTVRTS